MRENVEDVLEQVYQENLEERIISHLAEEKNLSLEDAMDLYYNSRLAEKIHLGKYGIQYLDYKVLVQILCEDPHGSISFEEQGI